MQSVETTLCDITTVQNVVFINTAIIWPQLQHTQHIMTISMILWSSLHARNVCLLQCPIIPICLTVCLIDWLTSFSIAVSEGSVSVTTWHWVSQCLKNQSYHHHPNSHPQNKTWLFSRESGSWWLVGQLLAERRLSRWWRIARCRGS